MSASRVSTRKGQHPMASVMMRCVDVADVDALRSPEGARLLTELAAYDERTALQVATLARREHPAALVSAAMTQSRLRLRARDKFGPEASQLLLTPDGLEQATRPEVALRHAGRFAEAGLRRVADLCCGIGVDLLALARSGRHVLGVDRDPLACAVAAANAEIAGVAGRVVVRCADASTVDVSGMDGVFCDPARRSGGCRRTRAPHAWSPPWSFVAALLRHGPPAGVKVAPGIGHELIPEGVEAEWVSVRGRLVEAALWSGPLASGVGRRATLLPSGTSIAGPADAGSRVRPSVGSLRTYLYEPDDAVIRAGLVGAVVEDVGGTLIDSTIAYVTSDRLVATPLASAYAIDHAMPFQLNRLRAALRQRDVGKVVVKKRGSAVDPEQLRRRLHLEGDATAIVVLTRVANRPWALIAHRVRDDS